MPKCVTMTAKDKNNVQVPNNDPTAVRWIIEYPGMPYQSSGLEFADRHLADRIYVAMARTFDAGRRHQAGVIQEAITYGRHR